MIKPKTADGYNKDHTLACERALVTLLHGFGTYKHTIRLVGGLVPRYLTPEKPPHVPPHAGTMDVDVVLNIEVLAQGDAYKTLAEQLKAKGFERKINADGKPSSWRWQRRVGEHEFVLVEFLRDADDEEPGNVQAVDGEKISALKIRHAGIVHDWYQKRDVTAELLTGEGVATETVHFADAVAFILLKALAFNDRAENKDAGDLVHVMRYAMKLEDLADQLKTRRASGLHALAIDEGLAALERRFCDGGGVEGYQHDGPVLAARFAFGTDPSDEDARVREQRNVSGLVSALLQLVRQ